jgi:FixJ family two-component response regulator
VRQQVHLDKDAGFLEKPFSVDDLLLVVARALGPASA